MKLKRLAEALIGLLMLGAAAPAFAQTNVVTTQNNLVAGHAVQAVANRIVADACGSGNGQSGACITDLGITNAGIGLAINNGPNTAAYNFFQFGFDASNNPLIKIGRSGAGTKPGSLTVNVNGTNYQFPGSGNGNVSGPVSSTLNGPACWNSTSGALLQDCGNTTFVGSLTATTGSFSGAVTAATGQACTAQLTGDASNGQVVAAGTGCGLAVNGGPGSIILKNNNGPALTLVSSGTIANNIQISSSTTGNAPSVNAIGNDTNVGLSLVTKGTGIVGVGNYCTATDPGACNAQRGRVTSSSFTTAAQTATGYTFNNSLAALNGNVLCTLQSYSGSTGLPTIQQCFISSNGVVSVTVLNVSTTAALNGSIQFAFELLN